MDTAGQFTIGIEVNTLTREYNCCVVSLFQQRRFAAVATALPLDGKYANERDNE